MFQVDIDDVLRRGEIHATLDNSAADTKTMARVRSAITELGEYVCTSVLRTIYLDPMPPLTPMPSLPSIDNRPLSQVARQNLEALKSEMIQMVSDESEASEAANVTKAKVSLNDVLWDWLWDCNDVCSLKLGCHAVQ